MQYFYVTNVSSITTTKILQKYITNKSQVQTKHRHTIYNIKTFVNKTFCHTTILNKPQIHTRHGYPNQSERTSPHTTYINQKTQYIDISIHIIQKQAKYATNRAKSQTRGLKTKEQL